MKILFVNEIIDELGHYDSYIFKDIDFDHVLNSFLTKANGVHTILAFKADTVILNKGRYKKWETLDMIPVCVCYEKMDFDRSPLSLTH